VALAAKPSSSSSAPATLPERFKLRSEGWQMELYRFMNEYDNEVEFADVQRWVKGHAWICVSRYFSLSVVFCFLRVQSSSNLGSSKNI
jgi:hypothetical protein